MAGDGFISLFCMPIFKGTRYGASGDGFREKSISSVNCEVSSPVCLRVQEIDTHFNEKTAKQHVFLHFYAETS